MSSSLLIAIRPKTLVAAFSPVTVATALASKYVENLSLWLVINGLFCALFLQIATNLINDAEDCVRGADDENRIGPKRVASSGMMEPQKVKIWGFFFMGLALLFGIPLMMRGGLWISLMGLASLWACYAYTAGPFPLAYKGFGEVFVMVFFGFVAVLGLFYLITLGPLPLSSFIAALQVGSPAVALIAINNYRDIDGDRKVLKNTLAVRLGEAFARKEIQFFLFVPYILGVFWYKLFPLAAAYPLLSLPLAFFIAIKVAQSKPSPVLNKYLALTALLQILFSSLLVFGLLA